MLLITRIYIRFRKRRHRSSCFHAAPDHIGETTPSQEVGDFATGSRPSSLDDVFVWGSVDQEDHPSAPTRQARRPTTLATTHACRPAQSPPLTGNCPRG